MSQKPPKWFDAGEPASNDTDRMRRKQLLEELPKLMERQRHRGRADSFYPYLLMRSVLGDRGDRPFNACFWESPDIWTAPGDPAVSPAIPADHGGQVTAAQPNTIYAHVWNLGFAPLAGIKVEYHWFNPSLGVDGTHGTLVGVARCELAGRGMPGSHKLVKCPRAWVPVVENGGHECLVVRVSGIGDPLGANEWHPWQNRHVAQRNISVVPAGANLAPLVSALHRTRPFNTRIQLIQLGPREGELARLIASPRLRAASVDTHVLGEMNAVNEVIAPAPSAQRSAGVLASVHPMAAGGPPPPPVVHDASAIRTVDMQALFGRVEQGRHAPDHLASLFTGVRALHADADNQAKPRGDEAQVLRLATYSGDQLVGGYTLVVEGR
jgi:hypothetical protein